MTYTSQLFYNPETVNKIYQAHENALVVNQEEIEMHPINRILAFFSLPLITWLWKEL